MHLPPCFPRLPRQVGLVAAVFTVAMAAAADPASADPNTTVVYDDAGSAPQIGLIGDSTLSGVRWQDDYGDLREYNFVFDSASCRRLVERSCWSREDYRPETALQRMQQLSGQWGDVLVVMSGYNDSGNGFVDGVDAIVAEAKRQGISHVMWLTMRTAEVSYEDPLHLTNVDTYSEDNEVLMDRAAQLGGYLQLADWETHSAEKSSWFEYDGVHLTPDGVDGVTTFIADQVGRMLAGENVTPPAPPWETVGEGDDGIRVVRAQEGLIDAGIAMSGGVDGTFGTYTAEAVRTFQAQQGIGVSGVVDEPTAIALGVYTPPTDAGAEAVTTDATPPATTKANAAATPVAATPEATSGASSDATPATTTGTSTGAAPTPNPNAPTPTTRPETSTSPLGAGIVIAPAVAGASAVLALAIKRRMRSPTPRHRSHR